MSRRIKLGAGIAGIITALLVVTLILPSGANAAAPSQRLQDQLANCQDMRAVAQTAAERTWGDTCIRLAQRALNLPSTTPPSTATPSSSPTASSSPTPTVTDTPSPSPSPTSPPPTGWPNASNTGVPPGTVLTTYTGPCTITTPTTIDAKTINCGTLFILAPVVITRSKVNGQVLEDFHDNASISLDQVEVDGGKGQGAAVSNTNVTVTRSNIHGGAASVQCGSNCTVIGSYLHGQYAPLGAGWHDDGFITNGGDNMVLRDNAIICDEGHGACTADILLAADFGKVTHVTVDHNLLMADANVQYCTYGGSNRLGAENVTYTNNVFQRGANRTCGRYGATIYIGGPGSVFTGNAWDDGTLMPTPQ